MTQEAEAAVAVANSTFTNQLASAAMLAYLLQWVKQSKLIPWVSDHTKGINYALTGLMSFIAALGIHYQFDPTAGVLTIGGLHASTIIHGLWDWGCQWCFQQGAADMIFTKSVAKDVQQGEIPQPTGAVDHGR